MANSVLGAHAGWWYQSLNRKGKCMQGLIKFSLTTSYILFPFTLLAQTSHKVSTSANGIKEILLNEMSYKFRSQG